MDFAKLAFISKVEGVKNLRISFIRFRKREISRRRSPPAGQSPFLEKEEPGTTKAAGHVAAAAFDYEHMR